MIICPNKECGNYKQELDNNLTTCPECGTATENYVRKGGNVNITLGVAGIIAGFAGFIIGWSMNVYIGIVLGAAGLVLAVVSKSKGCIIAASFLAFLIFAMIVIYLDPFGWDLV